VTGAAAPDPVPMSDLSPARYPPPHPVELLRMAARTARAEPGRVLLPAVVIFGLDAVSDTGFNELSADHLGLESLAGFVVLAFSTLGLTFYSGLLEKLVGAVEQDRPAPPVGQVLRTLPYGRLLLADGILWAASALASLAFVIPGLVVTTLCVLVGPTITAQDTTIGQAFRTSIRLVAPSFPLALGLVTLPLAVEHEVVDAVLQLVPNENLALVYASNLAMGLTFGVALGLVEVALAERLLHGARGPANPIRSAGPGSVHEVHEADRATEPDRAGGIEGGHHARDDSRNRHAGTRAHPPTG
jgi:hypothetical protein